MEKTQQEPRRAWALWNQLAELEQMIWEHYEQYFLEFIIDELDEKPPGLEQDP